MNRVLKLAGAGLLLVVATGVAFYGWASVKTSGIVARTVEVHDAGFPVPFPLTEEEVAAQGLAPEEAEVLAMERAVERGASPGRVPVRVLGLSRFRLRRRHDGRRLPDRDTPRTQHHDRCKGAARWITRRQTGTRSSVTACFPTGDVP